MSLRSRMCCRGGWSLACLLDTLTECRWPAICAWHDRSIGRGQ